MQILNIKHLIDLRNFRLSIFMIVTLILYFKVLMAQSVTGTAIAAIKTRDVIVVGADIYVSNSKGQWNGDIICKISCSKNLFFVANGIASVPEVDYEIFSLVEEAASISGSFKSRISNVSDSLIPKVGAFVNYLKLNDKEGYSYCIRNSPVSVSFFGAEGDSIYLANLRYSVTPGRQFDTVSDTIIVFGKNETSELFIGDSELSEEFNHIYGKQRLEWTPFLKVKKFLQFMVENSKGEYGPPLNIVWVDKSGNHGWLEGSNKVCQKCK